MSQGFFRSVVVLFTVLLGGCAGGEESGGPGESPPKLSEILAGLESDSVAERARAAAAVGEAGLAAAECVPILVHALEFDEPSVRRAAAKSLGKLGVAGRGVLAKLLGNAERRARKRLLAGVKQVLILGEVLTPQDIAHVGAYWSHERRAWAALFALARENESISAMGELLLPLLLEDPDAGVREAARAALAVIGCGAAGTACPPGSDPAGDRDLRTALANPTGLVRWAAARLLVLSPAAEPAMADALAGLLDDSPPYRPAWDARKEALEALLRMGDSARGAIPALLAALDRGEEGAARVLHRLGQDAALIERLESGPGDASVAAALGLADSDPVRPDVVAALAGYLDRTDRGSRDVVGIEKVLAGLGRMGPGAADAVGSLEAISKQVVPRGDAGPGLVIAHAAALARIDPASDRGLPVLLERVRAGRYEFVRALTGLPELSEEAAAALVGMIEERRFRSPWMIDALGRPEVDPGRAVPLLIGLCEAEPEVWNLPAGTTFAEARDQLFRLGGDVRSLTLRRRAIGVLGRIGRPAARPALPVLSRLARGSDLETRYLAARAISRIR